MENQGLGMAIDNWEQYRAMILGELRQIVEACEGDSLIRRWRASNAHVQKHECRAPVLEWHSNHEEGCGCSPESGEQQTELLRHYRKRLGLSVAVLLDPDHHANGHPLAASNWNQSEEPKDLCLEIVDVDS